ncbi:hypothetical protein [Runella zeae]|uniref:hypothetical protein n=1 Tax=Runella zeae TaxID=94255 RepID=UPI00146C6D3A
MNNQLATDGKSPVRLYCEPYISSRHRHNYLKYTFHGCLDIQATYWKSYLNDETELVIDTRKLGGSFEKIDNIKLSYEEFLEFVNQKLSCFGVFIKNTSSNTGRR